MHRLSRWLPVTLFAVSALLQARSASAQLGSKSAEEWIRELDAPARVSGLKVPEVIAALKIKAGQVIADIGSGSGVFSLPMGRAVRPGGTVYAVDIDQELLNHVEMEATEQGMVNVKPIMGGPGDPLLPVDVDLVFMNDVLHHIEDRANYLATVALYLKPGARVAIIDFLPAQSPHKDDPTMVVSEEQATKWLEPAGLKPVEHISLYSDRWFVVYAKQ
jgi:cyclopropane fatty-acyl-phospholipid synthase-like methyltransferase